MADGPFRIPTEGPGRLATMAAPSGEAQLEAGRRGLHASGVTTLVSLLSAEEEVQAGLAQEATTCAGPGCEGRTATTGRAGAELRRARPRLGA